MKKYELTPEGNDYLKKGLPEKRLANFLNKQPAKSASLDEARKNIENFHIALKWALEKGWVSKKDNKLILLKVPSQIEEETALKAVEGGKDVGEGILNILMQRKLVVRITETYKKTQENLAKADNVIEELTHDIVRTGLWKGRKFKKVNVEVIPKKIVSKTSPGKKQPYNQFLWQVRGKLVDMGFREMTGPLIETEFWNFDALFQPQNHPARDWTQTYSLKQPKSGELPDKKIVENVRMSHEKGVSGSIGWQYRWDPRKAMRLIPRAHGTCLSARILAGEPEIPGKYFAMARCYRPDVIDATHGVEFNQTEGIVVGEDLDFKNLLGLLKTFAIEIAGAKKIKFLPDFYPFTEPSCQLSALHPEMGWIELGGSGIFREELTKPLGVDVPVLAWGLGIDRLAMFKLGLSDIRELFSRNLEWLRKV